MSNSNGSMITKAIGLIVVALVAIFVFKLLLSAIGAAVSLFFTLALLLIVGYAVVWLVRKL